MKNRLAALNRAWPRPVIGALTLSLTWTLAACTDTRTAGKTMYQPKVETVTHYSVQLGPEADSKDVVYVLLRAVADKRQAVLDSNDEAREAANRILVSLAAPEMIVTDYRKRFPKGSGPAVDPTVRVNEVARSWGPALAHYVDGFPRDHAECVGRMTNRPQSETQTTVSMPVREERFQSSAVLRVRLVREKGYWRIWKLDYGPSPAVTARGPSPAGKAAATPSVTTSTSNAGATKPATRSADN